MTDTKKVFFLDIMIYLLIFFVFMGSNFFKFHIFGINFNIARTLMIIVPMLFFINAIRNIKSKKDNEIYFKDKYIKYCIILFIMWSIYSICSIYKNLDLKTYFIMNFFICIGTIDILFFFKYVNFKEKGKNIFNIINVAVFINCIYYLYLFYIKNQNIGGFYHNSNDLATVLLIAIPSALFMLLKEKKGITKWINVFFLIVYIYSFINIFSRACILGVIFAIFIFLILLIIKYKNNIFKSIKLTVLFIVIAILCLILFIYVYSHYVGKLNIRPIENAQTSNQVRVNLIFNGLHFLSKGSNLIFGIGSGNNSYYLENYSIYSIHKIYNFHNFWLDLLVEYGLIIFIAFIFVYIIICKNLYLNIKKDGFTVVSSVFLFFLIAFIIASISSSTIITREWLWIIFAIMLTHINKGG